MSITILAIESSCDDTSAAVYKDGKMCSNIIANQDVHKEWGGIVPELASRAHIEHIVPVVDAAIQQANIKKSDISAVAFTRGPGLIGSLLVGVSFAKSFALALNVPLIEVNHMQAHILAHFIDKPVPDFPFLCLTVSGGHTQIVLVKDYLDMEIVGKTLDDAAGEAFDKTAKLLELDYPGGPMIDKLAKSGNPEAFHFTEPDVKDLDFSFSGVKSSVLYFLQKKEKENAHFIEQNLNDLCASIQHRIVSVLIRKMQLAIKKHPVKHIAVAGGVSANSRLRDEFLALGKKLRVNAYIPDFQYCIDNAGMIAIVGYYKYKHQLFTDQSVEPAARLPMH